MKPIDVAVTRLAARQYSLAHRNQLLDLGMTARQIQSRVEAGWLVPVHRDVYRLAGGRSSARQSLLAACLTAGSAAAASHRSAGALWGMRGVEADRPEITMAPGPHRRMTGVVVHRTDRFECVQRARIPVTTPARTLLDLGAVAPASLVESALEDVLMRRLVTFQLLTNTLARLGGSGRRGAAVLRALVEERDPATAPTQSVLEDELLRVLRRGGLPAPVRQYNVGPVVLDCAYPDIKLGIEADSRIWHGGRFDVQRNSDKANFLLARGWRVLHFTAGDIRRRAAYVVETVLGELAWAA